MFKDEIVYFFSNLYFWVKLDGQLLADKFEDTIGAAQQVII